MTALIITTLTLVGLILWVLFSPVIIRIDTVRHSYEVSVLGFVRAWLGLKQDIPALHIQLPFYRTRVDPLSRAPSGNKKRREPKKPSSYWNDAHRITNVIRSFQISTFEAALDTNDYTLNAQLYPLAIMMEIRGMSVSINFQGNTFVLVELRNTIWRMLLAYLRITKY